MVGGDAGVLAPVVLRLLVLGVASSRARSSRRYLRRHDGPERAARPEAGGVRRSQRMDLACAGRLRTGRVASRSISDLQLVQGSLSMVPLSAGTVVLVVVAVAAMLARRCSPWSRW
ncbi:ABC transporter ATP-binding protein [Pseudonocardia sp. MCCB 268]|nr:ABC transporter ATP-binding protein [Pseudonocardia cytotoxica]